MKKTKMLPSFAAGLAGAVSLTIIHETIRQVEPDAPRMDLLGENALAKILKNAGVKPPQKNTLYTWTMAGDVAGNALYYSLVGIGKPKNVWLRGTALGLAAGLGALLLPKPLGLKTSPSNRTVQTQLMTVAYYTFGGLVAAGTARWLQKRKKKNRRRIG